LDRDVPGSTERRRFALEQQSRLSYSAAMKVFYSGPVVNTEMLVAMLEKHGITATQEFEDTTLPDDGDLNRLARVLVPDADYDRAHRLFYSEREDEL